MGIMSFLSGGGLREVGDTAEQIGGIFTPNAEASAQRAADRATSAQAQFAAEFAARERKGWFNALVDGLNRLPRPAMAYGTIGLFVYAMRDPVGFAERMQGLAVVPDQLWWLFGAIVGFYFGARELKYSREAKFAEPQVVQAVVDNIEMIRTLRDNDDIEDPVDVYAGSNQAISDWKAQQ